MTSEDVHIHLLYTSDFFKYFSWMSEATDCTEFDKNVYGFSENVDKMAPFILKGRELLFET